MTLHTLPTNNPHADDQKLTLNELNEQAGGEVVRGGPSLVDPEILFDLLELMIYRTEISCIYKVLDVGTFVL